MNKSSCVRIIVAALIGNGLILPRAEAAGNWDFDGQAQLTKAKIEAFLIRAVTHFDTLSFGSFNEAEFARTKGFLLRTGAKFIHGGELSWGKAYPTHDYWDKCKFVMRALHDTRGLQDVMVEGFIAEHIGSNADATLIPPWLWKEMQEKGIIAKRKPSPKDNGDLHYFHYDNFFDKDWPHINRWGEGASVPDITKQETQLYFRYLLKEHIDAGFESIWFGGLALAGYNDPDGAAFSEMCKFAKEYAAKNARRHGILLTSHVATWKHKGEQLLDYVCFPSRMRYTETYPHGLEINPALPDCRELVFIIEDATDLPVLLEIDNYVCQTGNKCICTGGFDEITGYAYKEPKQRREFLKQYYHEVRTWPNVWCNNRTFLCMPGRRNICVSTSTGSRSPAGFLPYPGNHYSPYREHGGEEDTIAALFKERIKPPAQKKLTATKPASPVGADLAEIFRETFDKYKDGPITGQGPWVGQENRATALIQSAFVSGKTGRAVEFAADEASGQIDNKLTLTSIQGGTCTVEFDLAYKGNLGKTTTFLRLNVLNALPEAWAQPGGMMLGIYWGVPTRIIYQGDQSKDVLDAPVPDRWYHFTLKFDLDALTVDVQIDNKSVAKKLPLRDCRGHSLGHISLIGYPTGTVRTYLDNLIINSNTSK